MAQKLTATSAADEAGIQNYTRCKLPSTIRNYLAVPRVARGFIFVLIVLKPLKKAQNISLHGNVFVVVVVFFFSEGGRGNILGDNSNCYSTCSLSGPRQSNWTLKS